MSEPKKYLYLYYDPDCQPERSITDNTDDSEQSDIIINREFSWVEWLCCYIFSS